jgi:hypothetical protein
MKPANATELNRKSGAAKWRDLPCAYPPNEGPVSSLILPKQILHPDRRDLLFSQPRLASVSACSVTSSVRSFFSNPCTSLLNASTLLDQFIEQNLGPHMEQKAASL